MSELLQFDEFLFHIINHDWHTPLLDAVMPYWRSKFFWIPFYLFLITFVVVKHTYKAGLFILTIVAIIAISDTLSSKIIKKSVQRARPCHDHNPLSKEVNLLVKCGGGYSFTSSHATNHFALAFFLIFTLGKRYRRIKIPLFLWAASIAFGQVYVGVHYPLDVMIGGLIGSIIGILVAFIYFKSGKRAINFSKDLIA